MIFLRSSCPSPLPGPCSLPCVRAAVVLCRTLHVPSVLRASPQVVSTRPFSPRHTLHLFNSTPLLEGCTSSLALESLWGRFPPLSHTPGGTLQNTYMTRHYNMLMVHSLCALTAVRCVWPGAGAPRWVLGPPHRRAPGEAQWWKRRRTNGGRCEVQHLAETEFLLCVKQGAQV